MSLTRKHLLILVGIVGLLALTACTREITTVVQEEPQPSTCFECHSDSDLKVVYAEDQWALSKHGEGETLAEGAQAGCVRCHCNEGFIQYVADPARLTYEATNSPSNIGCFTCHAPHSNGNFGLRITTPQPLLNGVSFDLGEGNGCVVCHQARRNVAVYITASNSINSRYGPHHGPQGDMLLGTNGYEYAGYTYGDTPYHREMNEDGCVNCHMRTVGLNMGGHTFNVTAVNEETLAETFNVNACKGCHTDIGSDFDFNGVQSEVDALGLQLRGLLVTANLMVESPAGSGIFVPKTNTGVTAGNAGAIWNYMYVMVEDKSHGVHNPDYARDLLQSAINYLTPTVQ